MLGGKNDRAIPIPAVGDTLPFPMMNTLKSIDTDLGGRLPSFPSATSLLDIVPDDNQVEVDAILAKKEERRIARLRRTRKPKYQITLPIGIALIRPAAIALIDRRNEEQDREYWE